MKHLVKSLLSMLVILLIDNSLHARCIFRWEPGGEKCIITTASCAELADAGITLYGCIDFFVSSNPNGSKPNITTDEFINGTCKTAIYVSEKGESFNLADDETQLLFDRCMIASKNNIKIAIEKFKASNKQVQNKRISKDRVQDLAKSLNLKIFENKKNQSNSNTGSNTIKFASMLMGDFNSSPCKGCGACHNEIYEATINKKLSEREVLIQLSLDGNQLILEFKSQLPEKSNFFIVEKILRIKQKLINNSQKEISVPIGKYKIDFEKNKFGIIYFPLSSI